MADPVTLATEQTIEQARFAAREFVAQFERDLGIDQSAIVVDRMLFAFETGFLRGWRVGARVAMQMLNEERKET